MKPGLAFLYLQQHRPCISKYIDLAYHCKAEGIWASLELSGWVSQSLLSSVLLSAPHFSRKQGEHGSILGGCCRVQGVGGNTGLYLGFLIHYSLKLVLLHEPVKPSINSRCLLCCPWGLAAEDEGWQWSLLFCLLFDSVEVILIGLLLSLGGLFWMQKQGIWFQYTLTVMNSSRWCATQ